MDLESLSRYSQRGVSYSKKEVHKAIENINKGIYPNAFCKVVPDYLGNDDSFCNIVHADGAGTKSSLAYLYWRETGDLSVWRGIAQDSIVMNIDDLVCVGALDKILLSSTIGRNAKKVPGEVIKEIIEGNQEMIQLYNDLGIKMVDTGGETADVGDLVRTVIVDTTVTTRLAREKVIDAGKMKSGQVIVGLASDGQSSYEKFYNAGMGSNGLTSSRHDIFIKEYARKYPESYDNSIRQELVYSGKYRVTDTVDDLPINMGKAVLSPTRTYAPVIKQILADYFSNVGGIIHCSGGGQIKCKNFGRNLHFIKDNLFPIPSLFKHIKDCSQATLYEMYAVFNMGHRMELIVDEKVANDIIAISKSFNIWAQKVGYLEPIIGENKVTIKSSVEDLIY